jgi:hypothetical protein
MEIRMRCLLSAGAAALAFAAFPAALAAQNATPAPTGPRTAAEANAQATTPPKTVETIPGRPGQPDTVVTTHPGNTTPPPAGLANKTYPVCTRTLRDSCQNPGEGGAPRR